jgi:hypothetical protein
MERTKSSDTTTNSRLELSIGIILFIAILLGILINLLQQ